VTSILENGKIVQYMVMEATGGQMGKDILDNLLNINGMVMEYIHGQAVKFIKESTKMICMMDMDGLSILIKLSMMVYGKMVNLNETKTFINYSFKLIKTNSMTDFKTFYDK
jgi:hypothetical protein